MEDYRLKQLIEEQLKYDKAKIRRADSQDDLEIARELQNQFNQEVAAENPSNLVYEARKKTIDSTKSLVDPSWELIDPTPNIHNLFIAFNQQYFWNKLLAVCVSWSKRMTTCAGICSYQPRGGMCSITLSEPLLKLRPRKDLVETLLHEMIHAFLFVTHNNRDRDGHGPEFHKHMYRINGEAGTNITVYHSFHDEVRLYQQHWWKCNGPCQHRKPFFGMVRRASNRAPGPNDRWWAEHTRSCGGTFIKVKEPEKKEKGKKKDGKENNKPKANQIKSPPTKHADIRNFFPVTPGKNPPTTPRSTNQNINNVKPGQNESHDFKIPQRTFHDNTKTGNINGFKPGQNGSLELRKPQADQRKIHDNTKNGNINGFKPGQNGSLELKNPQRKIHDNTKVGNINGFKPGQNGSLELRNPQSDATTAQKQNIVLFNGAGHSLSSSPKPFLGSQSQDYSTARNHWLNKFDNQPKNKQTFEQPSPKRQKPNSVNCPVCNNELPAEDLNSHLDSCLNEPRASSSTSTSVSNSTTVSENLIECDICDEWVDSREIEAHKQMCIQNMSTQLDTTIFKECPICNEPLCDSIYDSHVASCAMQGMNDAMSKASEMDERVNCLVCKKSVLKSLLNQHLDECMTEDIFTNDEEKEQFFDDSFEREFDTTSDSKGDIHSLETVLDEDSEEEGAVGGSSSNNAVNNGNVVDCPVCQAKVKQDEINSHLDNCLG